MVNLHINYDICMHDFCISCFRELRGESLTRDDSRKREVEVHDHDNCNGLLKLKCKLLGRYWVANILEKEKGQDWVANILEKEKG